MPCGFSTAVEPCATTICWRPPASRDAGAKPAALTFAVGTGVKPGLPGGAAAPVAAKATAGAPATITHHTIPLLIVPPSVEDERMLLTPRGCMGIGLVTGV